MPLLAVAATTMDDRMILQDGSPGSGSGQSQQDLIVSSLARRKKSGGHGPPPPQGVMDRPLPPIGGPSPAVQGRGSQQLHHPQPVFGGISNPAYARQHGDQTG